MYIKLSPIFLINVCYVIMATKRPVFFVEEKIILPPSFVSKVSKNESVSVLMTSLGGSKGGFTSSLSPLLEEFVLCPPSPVKLDDALFEDKGGVLLEEFVLLISQPWDRGPLPPPAVDKESVPLTGGVPELGGPVPLFSGGSDLTVVFSGGEDEWLGGSVVFGGVRSPISFLILFVSFTELTLLFGWL